MAGLCNRTYHGKPGCWCVVRVEQVYGEVCEGDFLWLENVSCLEMPGAGSTEGLGTEFNLKIYSSSSPAAPDPLGF